MAAYKGDEFHLTGQATPERLRGQMASADIFPTLGVTPSVGRTFDGDEDRRGRARRRAASNFWRSRFGGDPHVLGRRLTLNERLYTIIGVVPSDDVIWRRTSVIVPIGQWTEASPEAHRSRCRSTTREPLRLNGQRLRFFFRAHAPVRALAGAGEKLLPLEIRQERDRMLEPDTEQPCGLSRRHDQARELEKLTAKAKGVAIGGFGDGDHGQTSFQRLPSCRWSKNDTS